MPKNNAEQKPWYKKVWIWATVGALVVVGGISNLVNGPGDRTEPKATTSRPAATTPDAATPPAPTPSEPTATGPTDEERATTLRTAMQDAFGGQEPTDVFASDPSLWYGWVNGVRVENDNAYVTLQVAADDPNRKDLGERAARALPTLLPASAFEGIQWLIVEDAAGVVIDQAQP